MPTISLFPHQKCLIQSKTRVTFSESGIRSGKSFAAALRTVLFTQTDPGKRTLIVARDGSQLQEATLVEVDKCLRLIGLKENRDYFINKTWLTYQFVNGSYIKCGGSNNPESLFAGGTYDYMWFDEVDRCSEKAYLLAKGRISGNPGFITYTSSPRGFNHIYSDFYDLYDVKPEIIGKVDTPKGPYPKVEIRKKDNRTLIKATTYSNTDLPKEYIEDLERSYSDRLIAQEFYAERINLTSGKAYTYFDRRVHVNQFVTPPLKSEQLYCFKDYNVWFDCGVLCYKRGDILYFFDEIKLEGKTHDDFAKALVKKCHELQKLPQEVILIGDPTGNWKRSLESNRSAYHVFRDYGFNTKNPGKSPSIVDRVLLFDTRLNKNQILINPKCKILIKDLEQVLWKEGKSELDAGNQKRLTHMADAAGYAVIQLLPYFKRDNRNKSWAKRM
ncbi:phage terminase, large subunit, PBSX family (TIGR01547) [uncultured Mediterranean phage uvMED]|nr:phage terminase, large subunit, PBSX family (TIGR01547) [uncultured Mediterranean phage uvMED]